ncbi:HAMP domain-containing histidine kinase [Sphaerospermopsis sp. LEGE 00249]|uniref:sensor histidine kinase n=1 Tax=Sphaerospermopsis sp. LEGE 00249 TaxID=1380707 RepID=UPI00164ECDBD|nr:HAMP domain-containing sensor histidine kinase [Sphaerospermopsis sp. LEGE 00249]MBC5795500.1 HAMP domain-containing histidine kinase [Sphaerospermopsis sp. LEGE 00249]
MTSLNEWLYLGSGIGLGIGFYKLFLKSSKSSSIPVENAPKQQETEVLHKTLDKLNQTQLAYQMAREMSQFQGGFLARTTHELRSPLNGLIGLHQLILNDLCENPEEEREFVGQAYERSLKLLKIIDEILSVARTEHGTNKLHIQPLQLTKVLEEVYKLTYMLAGNRNYPFTISFPQPEIYVLVDNRWLRQILVNLIDTTILQMEEGSIHLSSSIAPANTATNNIINNVVHIYLDVPSHAVISSEEINLIASENNTNQENIKDSIKDSIKDNIEISSGMKLLLNQKLLETMGGKLEIIASPITTAVTQDCTRLQIAIPLVTPEAELLQSE